MKIIINDSVFKGLERKLRKLFSKAVKLQSLLRLKYDCYLPCSPLLPFSLSLCIFPSDCAPAPASRSLTRG